MIDLTKLIELYINRKDKFKKLEERGKRRVNYFKEIAEIDADKDITLEEKRARKNSAAQKLIGNGLATQELVDYYFRHPEFVNFEIIAPIVGFWDQVLIKIYDEDRKIIGLQLNQKLYFKELTMAVSSLILFAFIFIALIYFGNGFINFMAANFYISKSILGVAYLVLVSPIFLMFLFMVYLFLNLTDLKRLVK